MRLLRLVSLIAFLAFTRAESMSAGSILANPDTSTPKPTTLCVQSLPEGAPVILDGKESGVTPVSFDSISPGIHILTLQHPATESWLTEPAHDTLRIAEGEQKTVRYNLRTRFFLASDPSGAEVMIGDSVIGTTPFVTTPNTDHPLLTLRKPGYEAMSVRLAEQNVRGTISLPLRKVWQKNGSKETVFLESSADGSEDVPLYISGAATLLSGVAAAYFKIKADDRYQQYMNTNDDRYLAQTKRLDTAAGIAIAATQVGLGLFTYFLFSK